MKTTVTLFGLFFAIFTLTGNAQNVNIPDANFKAALIAAGIDTSNDGEISLAEAELITSLNVNSMNISDLTGIEAFVNLTYLNCSTNQLTSLDVSYNIDLLDLIIIGNQITSIDLENNSVLTNLTCGNNLLESIDLSNNINLVTVDLQHNQLSSIDVSYNTILESLNTNYNQLISMNLSGAIALRELSCYHNQLTYLDISSNTSLEYISIGDNPDLTTVCVWILPFPPAEVSVTSGLSPNIVYSNSCTSGITENDLLKNGLKIFPNPTNDEIFITLANSNKFRVEISDIAGKRVYSYADFCNNDKIHVTNLSKGIYILKAQNGKLTLTKKIIIQ